MAKRFQLLPYKATSIGAFAKFPYSPILLDEMKRVSRFGEAYSMARVFGPEGNQHIRVPRNMAKWLPGVEDTRSDGESVRYVSRFKPRSLEQSRVITETVQLLAKGESFMVEAPTGFGKTYCIMQVIASVGTKTLIIVNKDDIWNQWMKAFKDVLGLTLENGVGVMREDKCITVGKKIVIAMVQSLSRPGKYSPSAFTGFGLVIIDECHRIGADHFVDSLFKIPAKLRLGISATPDRKDGREEVLYAHVGPVLVRSNIAPMTPRIITVQSPWTPPMTRKVVGGKSVIAPLAHQAGRRNYVQTSLENSHARNALLANFIFSAYKKGRICLVQAETHAHLSLIKVLLCSLGVPSGDTSSYVGGLTEAQLELAKTKRVILATYKMTQEATDIPWLDTLVMCSPRSDVRQIVGRILRAHEGKTDPVVFDVVDGASPIFKGYASSRRDWYESLGATIEDM